MFEARELAALKALVSKKASATKWVLENRQPKNPDTLREYLKTLEGIVVKLEHGG